MAQNDLASPYFSVDAPMWDRAQMPEFLRGLAANRRRERRRNGPLERFGPTMDAFARIIVPADPDVPGDRAAGEPGHEPFFQQMIRLIRGGTVPDLGAKITDDDARTIFAELDAHARAGFGRRSFAGLTEVEQRQLVDALLGGSLPPLSFQDPDGAAILQSLGRLMVIIVKVAYWTNFPEHRVRTGPLGFGSGRVIFSDPENQISNPNIPGTGTAWDYLGWHYPIRKGVEDRLTVAFLEADVPHHAGQSEAALADLVAKDLARTLINEE